jgi:formamidopyrimidine-DNA glycosylase
MPEMPEVEFWARRLDEALRGAEVEHAEARGMVALKSVKPPLDDLEGSAITGIGRVAKLFKVGFDNELTLLVHLMQGGRLAIHPEPAKRTDRSTRIAISLGDGRELRLRERGRRQRAWGKLVPTAELDADEEIAKLGPEAWPPPPIEEFTEIVRRPHHLHPHLRNQRAICGIGRSWVDEILWSACLSPFKRGERLTEKEVAVLHGALSLLGAAVDHYETEVPAGEIPDRLPMPLRIHKREGEPCPRCGTTLAAVHFAEHSTTYCPECQTGGKLLADRRLSRLLK